MNNTQLLNQIIEAQDKAAAQKAKNISRNTRLLRLEYLEQALNWDFGNDEIEQMLRNGTWKERNAAKKKAQALMADMPRGMTDFEKEKWLTDKAEQWDYENYSATPRIGEDEESLVTTPDSELSWAPAARLNACSNLEKRDLKQRKEEWLQWQEKQAKIHCPQFYCVTSFTVKGVKHTTDSRKHLWYFDPKTKKRKMAVSRIVKKNQGTCRMVFVSQIIEAYFAENFLQVFEVPSVAMLSNEDREIAFQHICEEEQKHITMSMCHVQSVHKKNQAFPCLHISFEPNKTNASSFKHSAETGVSKLTDEEIIMVKEGCVDIKPLTIFEYEDLTLQGKTDESDNPLQGTDWEAAISDAAGNSWRGKHLADMNVEEAWYIYKCMEYGKEDLIANAVNGEAVAWVDKHGKNRSCSEPELTLFTELAIDAFEDETEMQMEYATALFGEHAVEEITNIWASESTPLECPF